MTNRPIDPSKGKHEDHPGASASACPERYQVNASPFGTSSNGYGCSITGGHCLPDTDRCPLHTAKEPEK